MNILERNDNLEEGTFLNLLYYKNEFDEELFIDLINKIVKLYLNSEFSEIPNFVSTVFNMYGYINFHILSVLNKTNPHFDLNSKYLNNHRIILSLERLRSVIKFFIDNDKEAILNYQDDIGSLDLQ